MINSVVSLISVYGLPSWKALDSHFLLLVLLLPVKNRQFSSEIFKLVICLLVFQAFSMCEIFAVIDVTPVLIERSDLVEAFNENEFNLVDALKESPLQLR